MVHPNGSDCGLAIRNILVIGDTDIAHAILHFLSHLDPPRQLTLLTAPTRTPPAPPSSAHHHHARHLTTDFSPASLRAALARQDLVVSTEHGGDHSLQTRIVNAAVAAGATRFVPAEFGHDALNARVRARLPPYAQRARVIDYLRAMESEGRAAAAGGGSDANGVEEHLEVETTSGFHDPFSWVALAVGLILDKGLVSGDLGFDIKWQSATVHGSGKEEFAVSSLAWVGRLVARVVERWEGVKNRYLYAAGCVTTADEVVECLRKATGKEWSVGHVEVEECVKEAETRLQRGFPDAGMFLMERSVLYDQSLEAVKPFKAAEMNNLLGIEKENVEDIVASAVQDFGLRSQADCGCS